MTHNTTRNNQMQVIHTSWQHNVTDVCEKSTHNSPDSQMSVVLSHAASLPPSEPLVSLSDANMHNTFSLLTVNFLVVTALLSSRKCNLWKLFCKLSRLQVSS